MEEKSIVLTRNNSEMSKLLNIEEGSKVLIPTDYPNFSYKDFNSWGRSCISPRPNFLEGFSRILMKNDEEKNTLSGGNDEIEEGSKKKLAFGMSVSQKFDDFWAGGTSSKI